MKHVILPTTAKLGLIFGLLSLYGIGEKSQAQSTASDARPASGWRSRRLQASSVPGARQFVEVSSKSTGVEAQSNLVLDHPLRRLYYSGFVCGGVAVGDLDGDGRPDLFFANGPERNRVYYQIDDWSYEEGTTDELGGGDHWAGAATLADIDNDGDLDIYVCNYDAPNQLFINQGQRTFRESAKAWGLDIVDASLNAAFCDFDRDGDLDVYVLTNRYYREGGRPQKPPVGFREGVPYVLPEFEKYYELTKNATGNYNIDNAGRHDYLLVNDGQGHFRDVSEPAGITAHGHGLSITWWDYNHDGWPDFYVGNDFNDPDHLYRNQGDGTFQDVLEEAIPHTSWFSMGADFADLNEDGRFDFLIADMSATTHYGQKTTMGAMSAARMALVAGPPPQIMKNALYLSNGTSRFWEAAELAGLADSDWTWSIKLADWDNDSRSDVFVTNGMARNFNHSDRTVGMDKLVGRTEWDIHAKEPTRPEQNLAYRNMGDVKFQDVSQEWGLAKVSMSYAAAYSDLDRDGDLDLVVANLNEPPSLYRNDVADGQGLLIELVGAQSNRGGIGAFVEATLPDGRRLIRQLFPQTGFLAGNEPLLHFGLGASSEVADLRVHWPSGIVQDIGPMAAGQFVTIYEPQEASGPPMSPPSSSEPLADAIFEPIPSEDLPRHRETTFDDFAEQPLLPNKLSQLGPCLAVADVDADGDEDIYVGGASGSSGQLWLNDGSGGFAWKSLPDFRRHRHCEDMGAVFLDFDGDDDVDLYVVSGGVEAAPGSSVYRDRLYANDGKGRFEALPDALPDHRDSGGPVTAADFDRDGDLDLFVGGRVVPGSYPVAASSRLLENRGGQFVDSTESIAPQLLKAGLVTGACWTDVDDDPWLDLAVSVEWGPIRIFRNVGGLRLEEVTQEAGLANVTGWWNGVVSRDLDGDGDFDLVATNFGLNTKYHASEKKPVTLYYGDFAGDGNPRLIEAEFEGETLFPIRGKSCSSNAMPHLRDKFPTYHEFALASLQDIYTPKCLSEATQFAATTLESSVFLNRGDGTFDAQPLPRIAQVAPAFGVHLTEVNGDGYPDVYLAQNFFQAQPETGRMDGGMSQLLWGAGQGAFVACPPTRSGLVVTGDATAVVATDINGDALSDFLVATNDGPMRVFQRRPESSEQLMQVELRGPRGNRSAFGARVRITGSIAQKAVICGGSGYLSQSTPRLTFMRPEEDFAKIEVAWPDGKRTTHPIGKAPIQKIRHSD